MSYRAVLFRLVDGLSRRQKRLTLLIVDAALAPATLMLILVEGSYGGPPPTVTSVAVVSCMAAFASVGLGLPRIRLSAYGRHALLVTAKFALLVTLGALTIGQIIDLAIDPGLAAKFGVGLFLGCVASRYAMLTMLQWVLRQGQARRRVLIYGAGNTGVQMAMALRAHSCIRPVAFLDDDVDLRAMTVAGLPILSLGRLEAMLTELAVDRVLLALPSASKAKSAQITRKLQSLGLEVQALPSFAQLVGAEVTSLQVPSDITGELLGRAVVGGDIVDVGRAYAGRVVLVSGAGGSVGSELCRQLIAHRPKALVLFERCEIALYTIDAELRNLAVGLGIQIVPALGSISDAHLAKATMIKTGTEVVLHAAAYKHVPLVEANPVAGLANNMIGTSIFAKAAVAAGVARFLLVSTDKAVRPSSVMGATKRLAELVVQDLARQTSRTQFSTVRFGNVLGSSGSVLPLFRDQIARGGPVTLTHQDVTRYFMTLSEAAQLVLVTAAFSVVVGQADTFVLDMGGPVRIRDLAEKMIKAEGLSVRSPSNPFGDIEIVVSGLRAGEKLHEEQLIDGHFLPTRHPKIRRAHEKGLSQIAIASALNAARIAVHSGDQLAARAVIVTWVDGFPNRSGLQPEPINHVAAQVLA